jgi:purine-binding chemotaxis protein CheW
MRDVLAEHGCGMSRASLFKQGFGPTDTITGSIRSMYIAQHLLVFTLDEQRYALHLSVAERVMRAVAITPLPHAPKIICGVVNVHGRLLPVVDLRRRFCLPLRDIELSDRFIVARTARRSVIAVADAVIGVLEHDQQKVMPTRYILPGAASIEGVVKLSDGMVFVHNLDSVLSLDEERALHEALRTA